MSVYGVTWIIMLCNLRRQLHVISAVVLFEATIIIIIIIKSSSPEQRNLSQPIRLWEFVSGPLLNRRDRVSEHRVSPRYLGPTRCGKVCMRNQRLHSHSAQCLSLYLSHNEVVQRCCFLVSPSAISYCKMVHSV